MSGLTQKQQECVAFIRTHRYKFGSSPSYQEIGTAIGITTRARVGKIISDLEARGAVRRIKGRYRSVELIEPDKARAVQLNEEIHRLLRVYASQHSIAIDTAANKLLRQTLGAAS